MYPTIFCQSPNSSNKWKTNRCCRIHLQLVSHTNIYKYHQFNNETKIHFDNFNIFSVFIAIIYQCNFRKQRTENLFVFFIEIFNISVGRDLGRFFMNRNLIQFLMLWSVASVIGYDIKAAMAYYYLIVIFLEHDNGALFLVIDSVHQ